MTVKELKEMLADIPDDAIVIVETNFGDRPEIAEEVVVTREKNEYDLESCIYEFKCWQKLYDEDAVAEYPANGKITGVLIASFLC